MKKHTKRYMVIFSMWGKSLSDKEMEGLYNLKEYVHSETEYDTEKEWKEETKLIEEIYADTPRPHQEKIVGSKWNNKKWVFEINDRFWGYMVLDFEKSRVLKIGNDGIYKFHVNTVDHPWTLQEIPLRMLDELFRGEDEIPKDYVFDYGEYEGWLQFRWGDGKNAVKCDEPACKRPRKKKYGLHEQYNEDDYDELENEIQAELMQDKFNAQIEKEEIVKKLERW